ncbi:MAG: hypothetical protein PHV82_17715, partial [Victivallaceae bacterium]|nr:hypothetical protein [Victivallaceae bacterium]
KISDLDSQEKLTVFEQLLKEPAIRRKAEAIALELVSEVSAEAVANDLYCALGFIDVEELWDNSGKTRYGYVDVNDLAWEMFEDAVSPFEDELERLVKLKMFKQAKLYCMGILKGLWEYEKHGNEFSDWVPDAPRESANSVFEKWMKHAPEEDIAEMEQFRETLKSAG